MTQRCQSLEAGRAERLGRHRADRAPQHRRRKQFILLLVAVSVGMIALQTERPPALVFNFSPSLDRGLYRLEDRHWHLGDLVAVRPDKSTEEILKTFDALPGGRLLLKRIAAAGSDSVCRENGSIYINGVEAAIAKSLSRDGTLLPVWEGCSTLSSGQVFLLGDHPDSFDGRYLGPLSASHIVGVVSPLATFPLGGVLRR